MTHTSRHLVAAAAVLALAAPASAQPSATEILERSLTALGGRAAHAKLQSRAGSGTITLGTPAGDISGTLELLTAAPNKTRMLLKADLSSLGAGELVIDQRFDGASGYVLDSLQGNREIAGNQLENMRNSSFPHVFMDYKERGTSAQLAGKETVGGREAYVVVLDPASGSSIRNFIDAETYLPIKMVMQVDIPQLGQKVEQTTEFLEYKDLDGVKVPSRVKTSSSVQTIEIRLSDIRHNVKVDEALFKKPGA